MAKPVANQVIEAFAFFKKKMPSPQPIDFTCYISARRNARGEFIAGLVLITGIFMAVISATGIGMQTIDLLSGDQHQGPTPGMQAPRPTPQGALPAKQPRNDRQPDLRGAIDHIHNGKFAGNGGRVVSLVMGLALFFFSVSGIRMYWQIFQSRLKIGRKKVFWSYSLSPVALFVGSEPRIGRGGYYVQCSHLQ